MKISGSNVVDQPVDKVWEALLDPRVLVATIPGCERLEATGEPGDHAYAMTVTAGVAAIKGTYQGACSLSDLQQHESLTMTLQGAGAPGTVDATVQVRFSEPAPGQTEIAYDADAVVGGMVGGVGQRMLSSVSKRMAGEFFANVGRAIDPSASAGSEPMVPTNPDERAMPGVYTAPAKSGGGVSSRDDFLKGIVVGAGLVVLGVVVGSVFGRRR
ncbi:MAG TPA: carbon monoxide dehydrogenase subunit G [Nocardioides sp.]|uniref:SRPBCC family protein n=1 Tax=uncultured Nocardioides sp. TaxID=198441 RepID=UPI000EE22432|nr:carbon monoxide dehydrogenase subunit G [uncultured Nocardioides sp.]HCB04732.1 carbon monoxide dehydrogenase [Nocardioides sp.]HRD62059.1 carbon monoxide dehydrogenase subunit G [Nocardioides sp.]HRI95567.1 carbon monoxide dehydrogenase subunit G [Nocardioides sp.]HRK47011.1 carbon monoxide dehydrogenase subunit G [Nocardioides sp.]